MTPPQTSKVVQAALLIAGITVGGGFLALPTVVTPTGFIPAATALVGVWAFLGAQAIVVAEILCQTRRKARPEDVPGMATAAKAAFGSVGEVAIIGLLVVVVEATLVSQISRAGAMMSSYRIGCSLAALSVGAVVFGPSTAKREGITTSLNSLLTVIFCCMAVLLFVVGVPAANWTKLTVHHWKILPSSIPTFLQLLVYGEILPTVCHYLNYQIRPIRWAIGIGSLLPLILEVGWAALGIGLTSTTTTMKDPVTMLLATGPIQLPLLCLALSAILTTILGSYLALQSTLDDVWRSKQGSRRHRAVSAAGIVLPALGIASISPSLFLQAIDFAGSYPVLLLWGIAPPAIALRLRQQGSNQNSVPPWFLKTLLTIAIGLLSMSAIPDLCNMIQWLATFAKGNLIANSFTIM